MKYKAVIFDLFGTLIENLPEAEYNNMLAEAASLVSADRGTFQTLWNRYYDDLFTGRRQVEESIKTVCLDMGLRPEEACLADAYRVMTDLVVCKLKTAEYSLPVISYLNTSYFKTGLISNCSDEVPVLFGTSPLFPALENPVFSCSVGMKKPDPRIYHLALSRLGVQPDECLFVDDNIGPLQGAIEVGMTAVLIQDIRLNPSLIDSKPWTGQIISSIDDLPGLLG